MNWLSVNSVEELKTLGKFQSVKAEVQKAIGGVVNLKLNSWNNLYFSISRFQEVLSNLGLEDSSITKEVGIISDDVKILVENEEDFEVLKRWLKIAARVNSIDEFLNKATLN